MIKERDPVKTPEKKSQKMLLKIKKKYEKSFLKTAFVLCLYQIKFRISSGLADFFFSGKKQKTTRFLRLANKAVNKNICKCHIMAEKCEYYKNKIESFNMI
ncbi:MAG: hypothetical protein FWF92_06800 [Oscillospiraceae bacterium]|nr:hypothetical protein [Oscillospiraceae bacterium]